MDDSTRLQPLDDVTRQQLLEEAKSAKLQLYRSLVVKMGRGEILGASEMRSLKGLEAEIIGGGKSAEPLEEADSGTWVESIDEVAKHFGKSPRTVYRWIDSGMPASPDGRFDLEQVAAWLKARKSGKAVQRDPRSSGSRQDPEEGGRDWKDHDFKFKALGREFKFLKDSGQYVPLAIVEDMYVERILEVKKAFGFLSVTLPPDLMACKSEVEMSVIIKRAVNSICEQFARQLPMDRLSGGKFDAEILSAMSTEESGEGQDDDTDG